MPRRPRAEAGFTLMELLVSIGIFVLLGVLVVGLLRGGVQVWDRGEARRDTYERASILFDTIRADITCATIHREIEAPGIYPNFTCAPDTLGRPRLWFTRVGIAPPPVATGTTTGKPGETVMFAAPDLTRRNEIFYVFDTDPVPGKLYRGQFAFNNDFGTKLPAKTFDDTDWVRDQCSLLGDGILYLGFRFWSQATQAWDPAQGQTGPEPRWDSTRFMDKLFDLRRQNLKQNDLLDDILPHRVEITLTLERAGASQTAASRLKDGIDRGSTSIPADILPVFPEGPGYAKIDNEWIRYSKRSGSGLTGVTRGERGTLPASHAKGAALRWGDTFTTVAPVPAWKDDPNK